MTLTKGSRGPYVVALGGGHGLAAMLAALNYITHNVTAVVTVADDGGSSGRIRREFGSLPPGDLRMAIAAMCDNTKWGLIWRDVMQHRFKSEGPLAGHALGNLLILALWDIFDDPIIGLDLVGQLLGIRGRVLPMASEPLQIEALIRDSSTNLIRTVSGQVNCATTPGKVESVRLIPANPNVPSPVLESLAQAEYVILGPGSWYTSVLPHLLIPQLAKAILNSQAKLIVCTNLVPQAGETDGMDARDLLDELWRYAPCIRIDAVIADHDAIRDESAFLDYLEGKQIKNLIRKLSIKENLAVHDSLRIATALHDLISGL